MGGGWFAPDLRTVSRGRGDAPATAKAAYRAGIAIVDERTGLVHDYRRRAGVEWTGIAAPPGAPAWARERAALWNAAEAKENRKNSVTARELMVPLPAEVSAAERERITREAMAFLVTRYGAAVDACIHAPNPKGDARNFHAHILFTTRRVGPEGWGAKIRELDECVKKGPDGQSVGGGEVEAIRAELAAITNRALVRAGLAVRVDHRSYERRGIAREAEPHLGPVASQMERRGERSDRGDERRAVQARNAERDRLRREAAIIDLALERERRQRAQRRAEARTARERARFEAWATGRREALRRAQWIERRALEHEQARVPWGAGADDPADRARRQQAAMARLRLLWRRGRIGGLWGLVYVLFGFAAADRAEAARLRAELAALRRRRHERRDGQAARQQADSTRLACRHAEAADRLEAVIGRARQRREAEGWRPFMTPGAPARKRATGPIYP